MHRAAVTVGATGAEGEGTLHTRSVSCHSRRYKALLPNTRAFSFFCPKAPSVLARHADPSWVFNGECMIERLKFQGSKRVRDDLYCVLLHAGRSDLIWISRGLQTAMHCHAVLQQDAVMSFMARMISSLVGFP